MAAVLKCFLRELPEPLIAPALNDLFLMCNLEKRPKNEVVECLLLACLLLPSENLNVLSYLMQVKSSKTVLFVNLTLSQQCGSYLHRVVFAVLQ